MRIGSLRSCISLGAIMGLTGTGRLLLVLPSFVGLVLAVSAAVGWCVWLERHSGI
jgi:hypothetical protein